jgi:integrase
MSVKVRPYVKQGEQRGFEVDITFKWPDGEPYRERVKSPVNSRSGSKTWGEQRLGELIRRGKLVSRPSAPTFEEFAPLFIEHSKALRQKPSTIIQKERILKFHVLPRYGKVRLDDFNAVHEQRIKAETLNRSPKTTNNLLCVINGIFKAAVKLKKLEHVPLILEMLPFESAAMDFYEPHEFEMLVDAAAKVDHQHLVFVLLCGEAGFRCGEVIAFEQTDVDYTRGVVNIRRAEWEGHVTLPKGGKPRAVEMTSRLADALRKNRHLNGDRVLWRNDGFPKVTQVLLSKWMSRIQRRAGLKETGGIHILRHTFCSRLAMAGAPAKAIQELAGHKDLSTTQRYMHLSPGAKSAAIRMLEKRPAFETVSGAGNGEGMETA